MLMDLIVQPTTMANKMKIIIIIKKDTLYFTRHFAGKKHVFTKLLGLLNFYCLA